MLTFTVYFQFSDVSKFVFLMKVSSYIHRQIQVQKGSKGSGISIEQVQENVKHVYN